MESSTHEQEDTSIGIVVNPMNRWRRMEHDADEDGDISLQPSPSPFGNTNTPPPSSSASGSSGFFFVIVLLVAIPLVALIIYRLYKRYQRRYEQQMLDYRSRQADRVLGDMQMIPNEDLDHHHHNMNDNLDDNELI